MPSFPLLDRHSEDCCKADLAERYLVCWGGCKATERGAKVFVACLGRERMDG